MLRLSHPDITEVRLVEVFTILICDTRPVSICHWICCWTNFIFKVIWKMAYFTCRRDDPSDADSYACRVQDNEVDMCIHGRISVDSTADTLDAVFPAASIEMHCTNLHLPGSRDRNCTIYANDPDRTNPLPFGGASLTTNNDGLNTLLLLTDTESNGFQGTTITWNPIMGNQFNPDERHCQLTDVAASG